MRTATAPGTGLALALTIWAASLGGSSPTGPTKSVKVAAVPVEGLDVAGTVDWLSLGEEEVVAALVHAPAKLAGLGRLAPAARIELKGLVRRTEERIRAVLGAEAGGELRAAAARSILAEAHAEYRSALEALSWERWPADAPPR